MPSRARWREPDILYMQVCLFGAEEPPALLAYLRSLDVFEVASRTWLVAHPVGPAQLYFEIRKLVEFETGFVVAPLEPHLTPLHALETTPQAAALNAWLIEKQHGLKT